MSSIIKHKVAITNATPTVLTEAFKEIFNQPIMGLKMRLHDGEVTDWFGNVVPTPKNAVKFTLDGHRFPLAAYVENGQIVIQGDFHGLYNGEPDKIKKAVQQMYTAVASRLSLMRMGYRTEIRVESNVVRVRGVA